MTPEERAARQARINARIEEHRRQVLAPKEHTYDHRDLLRAQLEEWALNSTPEQEEGEGDYARLARHRRAVAAGLRRLFEIDFDRRRPEPGEGLSAFSLLGFLRSTARSYRAIQSPWSGYLEAGLLIRRMEEAGLWEGIDDASSRISELNRESERAHMEIMESLVRHLLGDRADRVVTSADLRAIGVDDTLPVDPDDLW